VVAAHNEEQNIENRIKNILSQSYPRKCMEIIIVSDGSTDGTNNIVNQLISQHSQPDSQGIIPINLICYSPPRGKPFALNKGVFAATGEIIIFADSRQRFAEDAIQQLVNNFYDERIGCVSGELIFEETVGSSIQAEMGIYWNFEKWLRKLESKTGSVAGATGAIYAIRKKLFSPIPDQTLLDDVLIPLQVIFQGYRVIFESQASAYDTVSKDIAQEKKRKIRTLAGNWQLLFLEPKIFNLTKNKIFMQFFSHKIFRLVVPYFAILLLYCSLVLRTPSAMSIMFMMFLILAIACIPKHIRKFSLISKISGVCRSIILLNYFAFLAPLKLMFNSKKIW